jgi:hypothetical protein
MFAAGWVDIYGEKSRQKPTARNSSFVLGRRAHSLYQVNGRITGALSILYAGGRKQSAVSGIPRSGAHFDVC